MGKKGERTIRKCGRCSKEFRTFNSQIKKGGGKYCSRKCWELSCRRRINRECIWCGKSFTTHPCQVKNNHGKLCSRKCRDKYNSKYNKLYYIPENHPRWKGGGENYHRTIANKIYREFNILVLCDICGTFEDMCIHHKDGNVENNNIDNLRALCRSCHTKLHIEERYEKQSKKSIS